MASKLKAAKTGTITGSKIVSTTITSEKKESREPPKGAKILSQTVTTSTEQIENGWLICKNYDIKYQINGDTNWSYYSKKWYSKTDPLEVKLTDASLADEFEDE